MAPEHIVLLIVYVFSMVSIVLSLYVLWELLELKESIRKERLKRKVIAPVKKTSNTWPPR